MEGGDQDLVATIDDKVVAMSFESSKFESGVDKTISSLDKLKAALKMDNAGKGFDDISKSAQNVQLGHIGQAVDDIKSKFSAMSVAALAVFAEIAQKAVSAGASLVKAFTIDPMKAGFQEYSINLNAIQTILANTQAAGTNLKQVNAALNELNRYSDKTIYNFSQMAKNIGTFTAAGVDLDTSVNAIKGIANLAALSGSNADQASTAMYQLSQALSAGSVKLQDWNSVVNAGMGGTVFQRALAQTAEKMGTLKEGAVKLTGPMKKVTIQGEAFRNSLSKPGQASWLTSDVLTKTLSHFTGDLTDAQLAAEGWNKAQIKAIQKQAQTAMFAATEVKTLSQVIDVAKETAGSGWAQTWQIIFGDFGQAKKTFTDLSNTINGFINVNAAARNKVLADWKALGGRTVLIDAIKTAFKNLGEIIKPIKEAFRDIFPATTGKQLYDLTVRFKEFADMLKPSPETVDGLKRTFAGLFAVLDIGKQIISGIFTVFKQLFKSVGDGGGSFLQITGGIGDFLVSVDQALKKGNALHNFFLKLGTLLSKPVQLIKALANALSDLFSGISSGGIFGQFFDQISQATTLLNPFHKVIVLLSLAWDKLVQGISNSGSVIKPVFDALISFIQQLGPSIGNALGNVNWEVLLQAIRTGLFGGLVIMFKQFLGQGSFLNQISKGFGGGIIKNIGGTFKALQGSMVAMQNNIKAKTLKEIAIAIALLTASVVALSFVDPTKLNASIVAIAFMLGELLGAMAILDKIGTSGGFIKLPFIAASLVILAGAIDLLVIAVFALSKLSWSELLKGLGAVGILLGTISAQAETLSLNSAGMIKAGIGITAIAVAMNLLAIAVSKFGGMDLMTLGKGLAGVAIGLGTMVFAMTKMPKAGLIQMGIGLMGVAIALNLMAHAVASFGKMDWQSIGKGLIGIGGGLTAMALGLKLMPKNMILIAIGLIGVTGALEGIAHVVQTMGGMSLSQLLKGLVGLAVALDILAVSVMAMEGAGPGALALAIVAAGISLLAPALVALGKMSVGQIVIAMVALAGAIAILVAAAYLITPVIPSLIGLGAAFALMGAGLALAGAGLALAGVGLGLIAAAIASLVISVPTGIGILIGAFNTLAKALPEMSKNIILGLLAVVDQLAATAPKFVDALIKILNSLVDAIIKGAPKMSEAFAALLDMGIKVLQDNAPKVIQAGLDLLLALLSGIKNNIAQLVTTAVGVITTFLSTIAGKLGDIIKAGLGILTSLLKGIANGITGVVTTVGDIYVKFLGAIVSGYGKIIAAGFAVLTKFLGGIADHIGDVIKSGADIIVKLVAGIGSAAANIIKAGRESAGKFINALATEIPKLAQDVYNALIKLMNGMATTIETNIGPLRSAGMHLGFAIIDGMTLGLVGKAKGMYDQVTGIMNHAMSIFHKIPGVHSPSTVTMDIGKNIILGLIQGLTESSQQVYATATLVSNGVLKAFNAVFRTGGTGSGVMYDIGRQVVTGFAQGLIGSTDEITSAFGDMNSKLTEAMTTAKTNITTEQKKLNDLLKAEKPDLSAIKESQKVIAQNEEILKTSTVTHNLLITTLKAEGVQLLKLSETYDTVSKNLEDAQTKLDNLKSARDDAIAGFTTQYDSLPDIVTKDAEGNDIDALATYMGALDNQAKAITAYQSTLDQLRLLGLDDATYQKLLSEGPEDQRFADALLAGGKTAVSSLDLLDKQLKTAADTLAKHAGSDLYDVGIAAQQGIVQGLTRDKSAIRNAMQEVADEMVAALKKSLKSKSPSQVMAEIGVYAMDGLALGITGSSKTVTDSIEGVANDAISAMQQSMTKMSDAVGNELDMSPTITPVLDLTTVRSQSQELAALTNVVPITAAASYQQAASISSAQTAAQVEQTAVAPGGTSVKFEQNNYSPESLSEIDIYRNTKNQISQLKSVLAIT